jgi:sorting nexin-9/18/33
MYQVTSFFTSDPFLFTAKETQLTGLPTDALRRVTVHRRFSHFISLHTVLTRNLPGIVLPPLPGKQYAGRFNDAFVEARRSDLEKYLSRLVRHPVVRYAEVLITFLSCESDAVGV